ncbi:F0F1 ATP synthase subunit delta [Schaalia sp. 19OD2882]|uniref:F0F1 ATP synthase subunit delta n=1 Tax=Schaalia sp. 19OD2882 TaxID=2794089 RepID=UPI001C1EF617|nr:F0F1 ATP synthase subunit delta [Schaalia sp. 19OD2882]QWW20359.1 F0F1 ATP synthase subunit delta [Schaalia sp. 19OD2882]
MTIVSESIPAGARTALETALTPADVDAMRVGEDLFGLSDILQGDARARRALSDPSRSTADKQKLAADAFGRALAPASLEVAQAVVGEHWRRPEALPKAFEALGVLAVLGDTQRAGSLAQVEDELFQLQEILKDQRDLRITLSDLSDATPHERANLAQKIFAPHVSAWTLRLLRRAVGRTAHGRLIQKLRSFAESAARLEERQLVTVETAVPFTEAQMQRLRRTLTTRFGSEVTLAVSVDPTVVGGFRLRTASEAVDASVRTRLSDLRRTLVG